MTRQLRRDSVDVGDGEIRVYWDDSRDNPTLMPSVTSLTDYREDPDKDEAIQGWKDRYDGQKSYARPWWKDQKAFKSARGTLGHFAILSQLGDPLTDEERERGDGEYGPEEVEAMETLKNWSETAPSANSEEVPYTPKNNEYDGEHAWDRAMRDISWAIDEFQSLWDERGLTKEDVIDVERFVSETEYGYAGQLDLLYEDDGETVLCDLKLASGIRIGYKLQGAAYARAVEEDIDRIEIIRLYPDDHEVEVSDSTDWDRSIEGLTHEFLGLTERVHVDELDDALDNADTHKLTA